MSDGGASFEIVPEPSDDERRAIEATLAAMRDDARGAKNAWWEAGVRETDDELEP